MPGVGGGKGHLLPSLPILLYTLVTQTKKVVIRMHQPFAKVRYVLERLGRDGLMVYCGKWTWVNCREDNVTPDHEFKNLFCCHNMKPGVLVRQSCQLHPRSKKTFSLTSCQLWHLSTLRQLCTTLNPFPIHESLCHHHPLKLAAIRSSVFL